MLMHLDGIGDRRPARPGQQGDPRAIMNLYTRRDGPCGSQNVKSPSGP